MMTRIRDKYPAIYEWMLRNLPRRLMFARVMQGAFDSGILWPRWGFTKRQMDEAKRVAREKYKSIKWE